MARTPQPGLAPALAGTLIALDILAARLAFSAGEVQVLLFGRPLGWECAFQARTGLPCPTCGMTRSLVLGLHGEFARAWSLQPAGPVALAGLVLFAAALLTLGLTQLLGRGRRTATFALWLRRGALLYACLLTVVWIAAWSVHLAAVLGKS